jgi:hypothetical protein
MALTVGGADNELARPITAFEAGIGRVATADARPRPVGLREVTRPADGMSLA